MSGEKKSLERQLKKLVVEKKDGFYNVVPNGYVCPIIAKKYAKLKNWKDFVKCLTFKPYEGTKIHSKEDDLD